MFDGVGSNCRSFCTSARESTLSVGYERGLAERCVCLRLCRELCCCNPMDENLTSSLIVSGGTSVDSGGGGGIRRAGER